MNLPYLLKLFFLCLSSFFLIHLVLALVIVLVTPGAMRFAARIRPSQAARLLFALRLFPPGFGLFIVTGFCVPSYLWFGPRTATSEQAGLLCVVASILALLLWAVSMTRTLVAVIRSQLYLRHCQRIGYQTDVPTNSCPLGWSTGRAPFS